MSICVTCGLPDEICVCEDIAREQEEIRILVDTRRYGKKMTIVEGITDGNIDVHGLLTKLKGRCACGGTIKEGNIELQGDHAKKVQATLEELGFSGRID